MDGITILPGGYKVIKNLGTQGGSFNQGMYLVQHPTTQQLLVCKSLLTETTSRHEAPALHLLRGLPGIITMVDFVPSRTSTHDFTTLDSTKPISQEAPHKLGAELVDSEEMRLLEGTPQEFRETRMDYIYLEFCDLGSLRDVRTRYLEKGERVPEALIWHVFLSMAKALEVCHVGMGQEGWKPICHSDVSSGNILLISPPEGGGEKENETTSLPKVVLADFGCAFHPNSSSSGSSVKERALEDVRGLAWSIDEFARSIGPCSELMKQNPEFRMMSPKMRCQFYKRMVTDDMSVYSNELLDLIHLCDSIDAVKRPTPTQLA
ncbi:hypothetical protein DM02DRAFT_630245 [Periconia macrospinosa]|uniref:non-specific serine/threonine protein kinase n=1 Tax=Periconia macrospinosa TaxID=97972 RepID=A0A2V1DJS1_9PLEO|nr:hypothetical protein DM02DRAFT_630245 [Periconia macrospinosa]